MLAAAPLLRRGAALAFLACAFALARSGDASTVPPGFQETAVITGRTEPTAVRFAPNGKVFVSEKSGLLWVYSGVSDPGPKLVVDLRASVHDFWDRGFMGLAIDPQYPARPYVYVLYTHDTWPPGDSRFGDPTQPRWGTGLPNPSTSDPCPNPPGATDQGCVVYGRLSRITIDQTTLIGTEQVLLEGNWCEQFPSHSMDDLLFGDDGYLYASAGEGASFTGPDIGATGNPCGDPMNGGGVNAEGGSLRAQDILTSGDPTSFDGSILRLDVSSIPVVAPPTNPLVGNGAPDDDFIIATGLRNPFRMTHRPGTSEIWVGDVGDATWEEINRIPSPTTPVEDFGWPCYEGGSGANLVHSGHDQQTLCKRIYGTATPPLPSNVVVTPSYWAYRHSDFIIPGESCPTGSSSITGMVFKTGSAFPAHYQNALFFEDSSRECMWVMIAGTNGLPNPAQIENFLTSGPGEMVDLQQGPDGALYYVDFTNGRVLRISYFSVNTPPTAAISATPTNGIAPLAVQFSAAGSSDPEDGTNLSYSWDLDGDGVFGDATGVTASRTYTRAGVVNAAVRVTDSQGASATASVAITAGNTPPVVTITAPSPGRQWSVGERIDFAGAATDPQDGPLPASRLFWQVILHHCHAVGDCHTHSITSLTGASGTVDGPEHEYPSYLELRLTATDLPPQGWFDANWAKRRKISFNNTTHVEDLVSFPVLVALDPTRIDYAQTLPGGRDLRFADAAGNLLPYEIEAWNPGGVSTVWVDVPLIHASSASDFIWMYYGNPAATQGAENPAGVWSSGYSGVWHLTTLLDSTANHNDGTNTGTASTAGKVASARSFNGASYVDLGAGSSLAVTGPLTMEAWIRIPDPNQAGAPRLLDKKQNWDDPFGFDLEYKPSENNVTALGSGGDFTRADNIDLDTNWHYLTAVITSAGVGAVYVDGVNRTTDASVTPLIANTHHLFLGSRAGIGDYFTGSLDEVRLSAAQRSAAWIDAQFLSMSDVFASYGAEEVQATLSATTSLNLDPLAVQIQFGTSPMGLLLTQNTETVRTPFSRTFIVGSHPALVAPSPQVYGRITNAFTNWSDGGAASHSIVAPAANTSLTASYRAVSTCADGIDNDGDGTIDFDGGASANHGVPLGPPDIGCLNGSITSSENPPCADGIDNDGDGTIDFDGGASANHGVPLAPRDPQCGSPWAGSEAPACGLGFEIAPVLAGLVFWRRRIGAVIRAARSG